PPERAGRARRVRATAGRAPAAPDGPPEHARGRDAPRAAPWRRRSDRRPPRPTAPAGRRRTTSCATAGRRARTNPRTRRWQRPPPASPRARARATLPVASGQGRRGRRGRRSRRAQTATDRRARWTATRRGWPRRKQRHRRTGSPGDPTRSASAGSPEEDPALRNRSSHPESEPRPAAYLGVLLLGFVLLVSVLLLDFAFDFFDDVRPITSILSARFEAGSKLARTCVPSRIAAMPAATG